MTGPGAAPPRDPQAEVIAIYDSAAEKMAERYEAIDTAEMLAPVMDHIPPAPARILDIGAGTGRDAAWLAARGHSVLAVEPSALREIGKELHSGSGVEWLEDALPDLPALRAQGETFGAITIVGVWQHLDEASRRRAIQALAALLAPGGVLILSLRHGPDLRGRPVFPCPPEPTTDAAQGAGLTLLARRESDSVQAANREAGVTWTWLVFARDDSGAAA